MTRTGHLTDGSPDERRGRLERANAFLESAEALRALGTEDGAFGGDSNSVVSLYVKAGIAAADAICIGRTGRYSRGGNHTESVAALRDAAGRPTAKHLDVLLAMKNRAEYNARAVAAVDVSRGLEAALALVEAARLG